MIKNQISAVIILLLIIAGLAAVVGVYANHASPMIPPNPNVSSGSNSSGIKPSTDHPMPPIPVPPAPVNQPKAGTVTLSGTGTCLPHRDTSGAQTAECAIGFAADDGNNYGLADADPTYKNIVSVGPGDRFQIHGVFFPKMDPTYDSIGVITVDSVKILKKK